MAALDERSSRERAFVYSTALYPAAFSATTHEVKLGPEYLNTIIDVYPEQNTVTHTITLPEVSADMAGSKINFSGPANALILVKSLKNQDAAKTILVSLRGRGEFVVLNNGNGDYNWATRWLEGASSGSGSPGGTARILGDVPTQKALDVIAAYAANGGPVEETDPLYFGQEFIDDETDPGNEFEYRCRLRRVKTGSPVRKWAWGRFLEAGV